MSRHNRHSPPISGPQHHRNTTHVRPRALDIVHRRHILYVYVGALGTSHTIPFPGVFRVVCLEKHKIYGRHQFERKFRRMTYSSLTI